ncbi:MFS general substrate transporter [Zopfia rhizophila CBS 207.26]|uniref:MFS general substrate transporter n=1 Tax=Zopfia rhizophila CBS 207.26 TaxID=1314779 RepID=A0A6A6DYU8_9PEZI|nr:MFS general substrate transporter [Zopfia rhizophila CBS 207.26]
MAAPNSPRGSIEEDAPLLSPVESLAPRIELPKKKSKPWILLVVLAFFLVAAIDIGAFLAEAPKTRVYEANLCLRYYEKHDPSKIKNGNVDEILCKIDPVQEKMAMIMGWQDLWDSIPGIVLALPFGGLADKYGRKWIFTMSLIGLQLNSAWILLICYFRSLPLQLTWFSSVFYFVGGGPIVASAIGLTMISDIVPSDKRTTIFLYLTASVLVAEMIAPIMAAALMKKGDWLPLLLALAIQQVAVFIAMLFPETLHLRDLPEPTDGDDEGIELETTPKDHGHGLKAQINHFKNALAFLKRDLTVALVVFTFLANRLGRQSLSLLIRYASKRYEWKIQKAAYLLSFRAATNLVALIVVLPIVNLILLKVLRMPAHRSDLWISRGSIVLTTLSFFVMGVSATPALLMFALLLYNLGTGFSAAMRSVSIHVVGGQSSPDIARLFACIAIMEGIGVFISGPLLSSAFQWGMDLGLAWLGIPFIMSGIVFAAITPITFVISVKDKAVILVEEDPESVSPLVSRRGTRDAGTCLRRSKSTSTVHRHPPPVPEHLDPNVSHQHAIAAATAAYVRAHANEQAGRAKSREPEVWRTKSSASRKSNEGRHFPPRESSFRSIQRQKGGQLPNIPRQTRAPAMATEKFPPFQSTIGVDKSPVSQPSITFNENIGPSSQPKPNRTSASSSVASQQIRKARSMYYASSVQTGSPVARPPAKYLTTPPTVSLPPDSLVLSSRGARLSPPASPRLPVTVAPHESVDKARDKYLQDFQQRQVRHKPSLFLAPFKKRQDRAKHKAPSSSESHSRELHQTPVDVSADVAYPDFKPQKEKRSFSNSLKNKFKKVFRRTSNNSTTLPVQQIEASRDYFGDWAARFSPPRRHGSFEIPSPDGQALQRVSNSSTGNTLTQRDIKRLTVIHEAKDSIGSEADHNIAPASPKRKPPPIPGFAAFREPMPMERVVEKASTPVDPKRVFSALMKEIDASKASQPLSGTAPVDGDVFVSSAIREIHSSGTSGTSGTRDIQCLPSEPQPESVTTQSKASSIKSFTRSIKYTIRTVTPDHAPFPVPDRTTSVRGAVRIPRPDNAGSSNSTSPEVQNNKGYDETASTIDFKMCPRSRPHEDLAPSKVITPTSEQIERRVERSKGRWKMPLEENHIPFFPRSTKRTFTVTNIARRTFSHRPSKEQIAVQLSQLECEPFTQQQPTPLPPTPPKPRPLLSPLSPSIYSRNTDGISLRPNDSVLSLGQGQEEEEVEGGTAVIITSHPVKSYVIGTPTDQRVHSNRSSKDWRAWLSHEVSELESLSQEEIRMVERFPYINTGCRSNNHSSKFSGRSSESPSLSLKGTLRENVYSNFSSQPGSLSGSKGKAKQDDKGKDGGKEKGQGKENVTSASRREKDVPLGIPPQPLTRPKSLQLLSSSPLSSSRAGNCSPHTPRTVAQYTISSTERNANRNSTPVLTSSRPRMRPLNSSIASVKVATRPKSAFDLRGQTIPRNVLSSSSPIKKSVDVGIGRIEPSPGAEERRIDAILEVRQSAEMERMWGRGSGRETPGQRMAERFLAERRGGSGAGTPVCLVVDGLERAFL